MKREMEIVPISLSRNSHNNIFYEFFQIFFFLSLKMHVAHPVRTVMESC